MSSNISIGNINVGLSGGSSNSSISSSLSNVNGGASLLEAAMGSLSSSGGMDFSSVMKSESDALSGASVLVSLSSMGASSRPDPSSFESKKDEISQISKAISSLNSPGVGMSAHEPTQSTASSIFANLLA